jgi:uncharacterized protein YndB with AHSA1/START domain
MSTVTVTDRLAAPVEAVFTAFTDIERGAQLVNGIKAIELLTPGGFQLGTRWRETRDVLGRLDSAEMEVTAFERNRSYTISHSKAGARIDTTFRFEPSDGGTTVSVSFDLRGPGLPPGLLTPVSWAIAGKVRDVLSNDLADLKKSIEQPT